MTTAPIQHQKDFAARAAESERIAALKRYGILDTASEKQFDDIVKLAGQICETPISLISLVDESRQWFKAKTGIDAPETPRDISACQYTILEPELMVVPDSLKDDRFKHNPLVTGDPHMRFYAGAPLQTPDGFRIGTLCVLDLKPRELTHEQKTALQILSAQVMSLLELRLALKQKEESEKRLNLAFNATEFTGFWNWNPQTDLLISDERFARLFGVDPDLAAHGAPVNAFLKNIDPENRKNIIPSILRVLKKGGPYSEEYCLRQSDGSIRWLAARGTGLKDAQARVISFDGVAIDITDKKNAEIAAREAEAQFRLLADSIPQLAWMTDETGYIFWYNQRWYDYTGTTIEDMKGWGWQKVLDPIEFERVAITWNAVLESGEPYEEMSPIRRADGQMRWHLTRATPIRDDKGKIIRWFGTNTDIEDKRRSEIALREAEQFNQSIIDSSTDCIKVLDLNGCLLSLNQAGADQFEIGDVTPFLHQSWLGLLSGIERTKAEQSHVRAREGKTSKFEGFCKTAKGTPKWWEVIITPILGAHGKPERILWVSRDITHRRHLEKLAHKAQENAESANLAKTEFLATMSHEIRTPMNAVIGLSTILSQSPGLTPKQKEYVHTLQISADALLVLINDLLDISKIEARSIELEHIPFSITQILNEATNMMALRAREKGLEFNADSMLNQHHQFIGDPSRIRQVILNLCSNAIKFTETGGVYINITSAPSDNIDIQDISIIVRDTGIGIAPEKQEIIFQKFTQADPSINRKYGGTGLGLAITKMLAEIMGGTISLNSEPEKGSTFTVTLPLAIGHDEIIIQETKPEKMAAPPQSTHRVLLVEDYAPNILVAGTYLESFGYAYDVAENGYDAIKMAKNSDYIAILMDVQMHGINGFETSRMIRAEEKQNGKHRTPIIGMTAHALVGDRENCLAADMDDYMSKPYNPDELSYKLAHCAARKNINI